MSIILLDFFLCYEVSTKINIFLINIYLFIYNYLLDKYIINRVLFFLSLIIRKKS